MGAAAYFSLSQCQVSDCVFELNDNGSAVAVGDGSVTLSNCRFRGNNPSSSVTTLGGAVYCAGCSLSATDCVFEGNHAFGGGAMYLGPLTGDSVTLTRCTFDHNAASASGSALHLGNGDLVVLDHCIVSFGSPGVGAVSCEGNAPTLLCCDVYGNYYSDYFPGCLQGSWGVNGNVSLDPLFCPDDLTLQPDSPCAAGNSPCGQIGALPVLPVGCLVQTGACCISAESCEVTSQSQCTDPWLRGSTCSPNPCPGSALEDRPTADQTGITAIVPNPALGIARIRFELAGEEEYRLEVFNSAGQFVRRLGRGRLVKGARDVDWDGRDEMRDRVPAGVYFVRLSAGKRQATSTLILVR